MHDIFTFQDYYSNHVQLSFSQNPFSNNPKHVWVICRYKEKWLLTVHPGRGLEFPGGKVEEGETSLEAAIREVYEETGAIIGDIQYIGQYKVEGKAETIIKNIYFAEIKGLVSKEHYLETKGPVLLSILPKDIKHDTKYSFMMKDDILRLSLEQINQKNAE